MRATRVFRMMASKWPALFPPKAITLAAVTYFFCSFMTRGFGGLRAQGIDSSSVSLLPGLDFGNHDKEGAEPILNYPVQKLQMLTSKPQFQSGESFASSYGDLDTSRAAIFFGMAPAGTFYSHKVEWEEVDRLYGGSTVAGGFVDRFVRFFPEVCLQGFDFFEGSRESRSRNGGVDLFMACWAARLIATCPDMGPTVANWECLRSTALQHLRGRLGGYRQQIRPGPPQGLRRCSEGLQLAAEVVRIETGALSRAARLVRRL